MTHSPAPSRGSGKLTINFGIVPIPVSVFNGIEEQEVHRSMRHDGHAVKFVTVDGETGEVIARQATTKVFVMDDGTEVPLTDEEIAAAMGEENGSCEIVGFYPLSQMSKYVVASMLQVRPQTSGSGKNITHPFDRSFVLLMTALATREAFALVRYTLRGKPRLGALTSEGTLRVLYWDDEVREALPLPTAELKADELMMAGMLMDSLMSDEAPVFDNVAVTKVREYVAAKAAGTITTAQAAPTAPAMDLMAALKASLEKVGATA